MTEQPLASDLSTEAFRPDRNDLDLRSITDLVELMHSDNNAVAQAISEALPAISEAIKQCVERLRRGGRLLYVGAGSAGRLGVLDAAECKPTFGIPDDQVRAILAGGLTAMWDASEGAEDDTEAAVDDLEEARIGSHDLIVGISASGTTPYVVAAVQHARRAGAFTVGIACNRDSILAESVDIPIEVLTGPEFVAGSTRLKAGTAQKVVLNMISTILMIKLGKTYGDLMVDVQATNHKLHGRAVRIIQEVTGASGAVAAQALNEASGETKTAIAMLLSGSDADLARRSLKASEGSLRSLTRDSR